MKEPRCLSRPLQYYCTAGKGMEQFLAAEVVCKLSASDVDHVTGKVFFTTCADVKEVTGLKSAERLFLLLKRLPPLTEKGNTGKAAQLIQERIIGEHQAWTDALSLWQSLRKALEGHDLDPVGRGQSRKRKREWGESEGEGPVFEGLGQVKCQVPDTETEEEGAPQVGETPGERGVPGCQPKAVTFRVCCRTSGAVSRRFNFQDLGRMIGVAISKHLGWRVDLKEPDLEVNVHLSDDHSVLGLPLLRLPLASRSYIKTAGLRCTVAWAMASLADIKPGFCVLDPMCGMGTILLEAAKEYQNSFCLGMDIDGSQLEKASENVQFAELNQRVELLQSSVTAIPVPSCSVDAVICDIPFGRKFGCKADMAASLPAIVKEMERVLCVGGVLVLLLSPPLSALLRRSCQREPAAAAAPATASQPGEPPSALSRRHNQQPRHACLPSLQPSLCAE